MTLDGPDFLENLVKNGLILDSNVLVLWLAGQVLGGLSKSRRLKQFDSRHLEYVQTLVNISKALIITPPILTESSNLLVEDKNAHRLVWADLIRRLIFEAGVKEVLVGSKDVVKNDAFRVVGYADTAILKVAQETSASVLSADALVVEQLSRVGVPAFNLWWDFPQG